MITLRGRSYLDIRRNHWQLIENDGDAAVNPVNRSTSFTLPAALQFLGEAKLTRRRPA
jgi:hypothetical protein